MKNATSRTTIRELDDHQSFESKSQIEIREVELREVEFDDRFREVE